MTNVHVLADESLGGIQREYVEVDRPAEVGDNKSVIDLLANLARRVTSLECQLADTQRNLDKFALQTESNTHDIAFLDERTAPTPSLTFNESQLTAVLRAAMVAAGGDGE